MMRNLVFLCLILMISGCAQSRAYWNKNENYYFYYQTYSMGKPAKAKFSVEVVGPHEWSEKEMSDTLIESAARTALKNGYAYFSEITRKKFWHYSRTNARIYIYCYKEKPLSIPEVVYDAKTILREKGE